MLFTSSIEVDIIRHQAYKEFGLFLSSIKHFSTITFIRRVNRRKILNFDSIFNTLTINTQFKVMAVEMDNLTFQEQVAIMAKTDVFLSNHGAQFTNIIFLRPGSIVIEIFHPRLFKPCYSFISKHARLRYYAVMDEWVKVNYSTCNIAKKSNHPFINCDIFVDEIELILRIKSIVNELSL